MLPAIAIGSWGAVYSIVEGAPLRGILVLGLVLALTFLAFVLFEVIPRALADWWGFDAWLGRQKSKNFEWKLSTLTDAQKAPFQMEHRCKLSPAEEFGCDMTGTRNRREEPGFRWRSSILRTAVRRGKNFRCDSARGHGSNALCWMENGRLPPQAATYPATRRAYR